MRRTDFFASYQAATLLGCIAFFTLPAARVDAQVSFTTAVDLALQNSPRIKAAQDDVRKAQASLAESRDLFIPSVATAAGAGYSYGITLNVPTIFTVNEQSLVYSASQRSYIDAARFGLQASTGKLADVRDQIEEDAASTYLELQHSEDVVDATGESYAAANRLLAIVEDRARVGFENPLDVKRARLTALQLKLDHLHAEDGRVSARERLGQLIGFPAAVLATVRDSIPSLDDFNFAVGKLLDNHPDSPALLSAQANRQSLLQKARGDARRIWHPQVNSFAQYGRVSPINDVSDFYNLHGVYNTFSAGLQVQVPIFDEVLKRRADESRADASRAGHEVETLRFDQSLSRSSLKQSIEELRIQLDIAKLDRDIAQDELADVSARLQGGGNGEPALTPKEEAAARIKERQRYLDFLDVELHLRQSSIQLLRQTGNLADWLRALAARPATNAPLPGSNSYKP